MQFISFVLGFTLQTLAYANLSKVLQLDRTNFDTSIEGNPLVLVNFCANGTSACQDLDQEFEKAASLLEGKSPKLATIDCLKEVETCAKYDVISYPAIRVFEGPEKMSRYRDLRKAEFITSHAIKKTTPNMWTLQKGPEVQEFVSLNALTLILRTNPKDEKAIKEFTDIATYLQGNLSFALEMDPSLPKKGSIGPEIVLYKSFGWEKFPFLGGTISKNQITKFIQALWKPQIPDLNQENYPTYMETGLPLAYLFASTRTEREYYRRILNHLSNKHQNLINFVVMDSWEWLGHAQELGLETFPAFVIHDTPSNKNFIFDTKERKLEVAEIDKFVDGYVQEMREKAARKAPKHIEL